MYMKLAFQSGFAQPRPNRGDNRTKTHFHGLILETTTLLSLVHPKVTDSERLRASSKQKERRVNALD